MVKVNFFLLRSPTPTQSPRVIPRNRKAHGARNPNIAGAARRRFQDDKQSLAAQSWWVSNKPEYERLEMSAFQTSWEYYALSTAILSSGNSSYDAGAINRGAGSLGIF